LGLRRLRFELFQNPGGQFRLAEAHVGFGGQQRRTARDRRNRLLPPNGFQRCHYFGVPLLPCQHRRLKERQIIINAAQQRPADFLQNRLGLGEPLRLNRGDGHRQPRRRPGRRSSQAYRALFQRRPVRRLGRPAPRPRLGLTTRRRHEGECGDRKQEESTHHSPPPDAGSPRHRF
jgi:hypothetical protein